MLPADGRGKRRTVFRSEVPSEAWAAVTTSPSPDGTGGAEPAPAAAPADRSRFALVHPSGLLAPRADGLTRGIAARLDGRAPALGALGVGVGGFVVLLAVLVGLGALVTGPLDGSLGPADLDANRWLAEHRSPLWDDLTAWGSGLANTPVVVGVGSLVASVLLVRRWAQGTVALAAALFTEVSVFLTTVLLVPRDRPEVPKLDVVPPTSSFPSGHTAASLALYGTLAVIAAARLPAGWRRRAAVAVAALVPLVVGFSRLYRGMHHPSDVVAGILLGLGALAVGVLAARVALLLARERADESAPRRARQVP